MMKVKNPIAILLTVLAFMLMLQNIALANGPPPDMTITISVSNAPKDAVYMNILVDKSLPEINLSSPNQAIVSKYPVLANSELKSLNKDGYVSYSLFFTRTGNFSDQQHDDIEFPTLGGNKYCGVMTGMDSIKIVLLNGDGKILKISDTISLKPLDNMHSFLTPKVTYDYAANKAQARLPIAQDEELAWMIILLIVFAVIRIIVSTGIEIIIALPFKIRPLWIILVVNVVTQIIISVGIPWMTTMVPYAVSVAIFEVLVYALEFGAYMLFLRKRGFGWKKLLLYTVTANTASLLIGLGLNALGLFWA